MSGFPVGIVTFLFTDIEGSTKLWEEHPDAMKSALAQHDAMLRQAIEASHGTIIKTTGDGVHAVFVTTLDAIQATLLAQSSLQSAPVGLPIKVRMGVHTGEAELRDGDYYGQALNRAARIMSVAHGGQILVSGVTAAVVREHLPADVMLKDLGEHRLKSLNQPEHLWQIVVPGLVAEFPSLLSLTSFPNNLPAQLTSFIGREKEIDEIGTMFTSVRLITLTGSGGTGKTRLSIEVGTQLLSHFAHGVWLIELASLSDEDQIIPALAQAFALQELPFNSVEAQVTDYLREKKLLLILDNCEHLIAACARLADDLLRHCAGLKILASSREAFGIAGEVVYHIPSLKDSECVCLFVERARAVNPQFSLTDANTASVNQICRRLDGIPLAIELAAARSKLLSVDQIAARLDDLFRLLVGGSRTALPRQQTLRALIDWSYDLLSDNEKQLLCTASVFVGGWTLDALEVVSEDPNVLENLDGLVNKSLVVVEEHRSEMRYFLLETIRQYAREKLFEAKQSSAARDQHFAYFDELSERMWDSFRALKGIMALHDQVNDEFENMRAAAEWSLECHPETALHLIANFAIVSSWTGSIFEALEWLKRAIEQFRNLPPVEGQANITRQALLSKALLAQGMGGMITGNIKFCRQVLDEAIAITRLTGDKRLRGYALEIYYTSSAFIDSRHAAEYAEEGFALFSEIDDTWGMSMAFLNMARVALARGDHETSKMYFELLKAKMKGTPISFMSGTTFLGIGSSEREQGHLDTARQHFEESLNIFKQLRHKSFENVLRSEIGHIARMQGDMSMATETYRETIRHFQDMGNRPAVAHQLECFGFVAIISGEPQRAAQLFGAAESLRERIDSQMTEYERVEYDQSVAQLHTILPEAEFNLLWAKGRSLGMEQATALAVI